MKPNQAGIMRLQREGRMAKSDADKQIKKHGKLTDNFLCLPDPNNIHEWYFVVWGIEEPDRFKGGYYLGKITCPPEYPQKAPNIKMITENGRFRTHGDGICLSISDFHPESWNPAWKVNQVVIGLLSFWMGTEYTYGALEKYDLQNKSINPYGLSPKHLCVHLAMESRAKVLSHEKFQEIFSTFIDALGIKEEPKIELWE
jgi:ubiquitin-protein ligase